MAEGEDCRSSGDQARFEERRGGSVFRNHRAIGGAVSGRIGGRVSPVDRGASFADAAALMADPAPIEGEGGSGNSEMESPEAACLRCRLEPATANLDLGAGLLFRVCETCLVQARARLRRW